MAVYSERAAKDAFARGETEFMRPLVTAWKEKLRKAEKHKEPFTEVAEICKQFYQGAVGFMWKPEFQKRFMRGSKKHLNPRFQITINKAFELVSIFGPRIYWRNPKRYIKSRERLEIKPEYFGNPQDPNVQQYAQQFLMQQQMEEGRDELNNRLMNKALNYFPDEQPGGGLARHSQMVATEALITGRGIWKSEPYQFPGSQRTLIRSTYLPSSDLLIDPDCTDPTGHDAKWMAIKHTEHYWDVEAKYGLPRDSLKQYCGLESLESQSERTSHADNSERNNGNTRDLLVYYCIYSKGGIGARLTGLRDETKLAFDRLLGDYAYLVIQPACPYPLNAPGFTLTRSDDEQIKQMFDWPEQFYADDRWPVTFLDFYSQLGYPWPLAPLAPGLGELMFLNVFIAHLCNRIWSSSRDFIGVLKSAVTEVKSVLENGEDLCIIEVNDGIQKSLRECIDFIQQPQTNMDAWRIVGDMSERFDMRVGLTPLLYAMNAGDTQSRTAADATSKQENLSVRPDHMVQQMEIAQKDIADKERFLAWRHCSGQDLAPLLGMGGSQLWDMYVAGGDPEVFVREMRATIEAGSARKPNRQRDTANLNTIMPVIFPELSKHADVTTDTNALNALLEQLGEAHEMDMRKLMMGPRAPAPPPPEAQQQMQQQAQLEMSKLQAEVQVKQLDAEIKKMELQLKQMEMQGSGAELQMEMQKEQMKAAIEAKKAEQAMLAEKMKLGVQMESDRMKMAHEARQAEQETNIELRQMDREFEMDLVHSEQKHQQDMRFAEEQAALQRAIMVKQAKAQPKPNGSKSNTSKRKER